VLRVRGVKHHASQDSDWLAAAAVAMGGSTLSTSIIHGGGSPPSGGKVSGRGPYSGGASVGGRGQYGGKVSGPYSGAGRYLMGDRLGTTNMALQAVPLLIRRLLLEVDT
jgi:hypothetical protein